MDWSVKLGATIAQAQDAVRNTPGASDLHVDTYSDSTYVKFAREGWDHTAHGNAGVVDHLYATRSLPSLQHALELLEVLVSTLGSPALVRAFRDRFEWEWKTPELTSFAVTLEPDTTWLARCDLQPAWAASDVPVVPQAEARQVAATLVRRLASVPAGTGRRAEAVARWHASLDERRGRLEHFLDVVAIATPDAPIAKLGLPQLLDQAGWLVRHDKLFTDDDDWRDALVVRGDHVDGREFGWQVHSAREGGRVVMLVEAPFATGILRTRVSLDELYPVFEIAIDQVKVTVRRPIAKTQPAIVTAEWAGRWTELSGRGEHLERIARLLVAYRARR